MSDRDTTDRTRGRAKAAVAILLGAVLFAAAPPPSARAQDTGAELKRFMYDDATITVHLRSYYLDRTNPSLPNNVGWAGGGWVGYETGWLFDAVRLGIVGYTSLPLVGSADTDGTLLFLPGPKGYAVLGQAYGKLKLFGQEFTGYRQLINQPEVNQQDNRMTPNTFEAYTLAGGFGAFSYFGGICRQGENAQLDRVPQYGDRGGRARGRQRGHDPGRRHLRARRHLQGARFRPTMCRTS